MPPTTTATPPSDIELDEADLRATHAWFAVNIPSIHTGVCVAMTPRAWQFCWNRFGRWEVIVMWDEFKAWADAVKDAPSEPARAQVMAEALTYFTGRMGWPDQSGQKV